MHLGLQALRAFLETRSEEHALVLVTVTATEGSTYRKAGAMMLIAPDGDFAGLVSGGCLEGDLVGHAQQVLQDGVARRLSYDLKDDDELLLGLGLGCGGAVHLMLQRLERTNRFAPLGPLFKEIDAGHSCRLALVCTSPADALLPLGSAALVSGSGAADGPAELTEWVDAQTANAPARRDDVPSAAGRARRHTIAGSGGDLEVLLLNVTPSPHVLICGAGPDVPPLVQQVLGLGWHCTVLDHREAFAQADRFPAGTRVLCQRPQALAGHPLLDTIDAAVVMTHHVGHDATYLEALSANCPTYLGLLGPRARRERLLDEIGRPDLPVCGPAGLDIGAELPEAIALAIMAQLHAALAGREGGPLPRG